MTPVDRFFEMAIVGLLASGYAGILGSGFLDWPSAVLAGCALFIRAVQLIAGFEAEISPRIVNLVTLGYVVFFAADWAWLSATFLEALIHLLLFLAVLRLFTAKSRRDYLWLQLIAFLEIVAAAILSASTTFFAALSAFLLFAVAALTGTEMRRSISRATRITKTGSGGLGVRLWLMTGAITLGVLILTGALFFLLPRTARAAFQHLIPDRYQVPGFSNTVVLGRFGELKKLETPVLHAKPLTGISRFPPMHWRGASLRDFDGRKWKNPPGSIEMLRPEQGLIRLADNEQRWRNGTRMSYEVRLNSVNSNTLFIAGTPEFLHLGAKIVARTPEGALTADFDAQDGVQYIVWAFVDGSAPPLAGALPGNIRHEYLSLPPLDPRIAELARQWKTPAEIESHLRRDYRYSLDLPPVPPGDPLSYFLFERRAGHCEYFASAMAVMLRSNGIPSRVVTGFLGGTFNPLTGWHVIRASDAHSWVEAWIDSPGGGAWRTFDPTPPDPTDVPPEWRVRLTMWTDAMDTFWHDWVLNYTLDQQLTLAGRADNARLRVNWSWLSTWGDAFAKVTPWLVGIAGLVLLILRYRLPSRKKRRISEAGVLYQKMLDVLKKRGVEKPPWMTPNEFAAQLPDVPWRGVALAITDSYYRMRYGTQSGMSAEIRTLLKQL